MKKLLLILPLFSPLSAMAIEMVATSPIQGTALPRSIVPPCTENQVVGVSGTRFVCKAMPTPPVAAVKSGRLNNTQSVDLEPTDFNRVNILSSYVQSDGGSMEAWVVKEGNVLTYYGVIGNGRYNGVLTATETCLWPGNTLNNLCFTKMADGGLRIRNPNTHNGYGSGNPMFYITQ